MRWIAVGNIYLSKQNGMKVMDIKKGQLILFSEGEHSHYGIDGVTTALVDFNLKEQQDKWEVKNTKITDPRRNERKIVGTGFYPWLVEQGFVNNAKYMEIHTGAYGYSDIVIE